MNMEQMCFADVVLKYHPDNPDGELYGSTHITAAKLRAILDELRQAQEWEAILAFEERMRGGQGAPAIEQ